MEKITGNATLDVEVGKGKLFEEKQVLGFQFSMIVSSKVYCNRISNILSL